MKPVALIDILQGRDIPVRSQSFEEFTEKPGATPNVAILKRVCESGIGNLVAQQRTILWDSFKAGDIILVRHCPCGKNCGKKSIETIPIEYGFWDE
jgi:hypothetical protein